MRRGRAAFYAAKCEDPQPKAERKRTPRVKTLIARTEKATGRPARGVTYHTDGSRTVELGEVEQHKAEVNEWDEWETNRHAAR